MSGVEAIRAAAAQAAPVSPSDVDGYEHLTDLGNARRLVTRHGDDLRYCYSWGCWLVWDNRRWLRDDSGGIVRRAKETVRSIYAEAAEEEDRKERQGLAGWAKRSEAEARIAAMISLARSEPDIPISPDELDTDPWLLTVQNGTIDLKSGELRGHRRKDLITKLAPVEFDPDTACPTFRAFLETIFANNENIVEFLQRVLGYALTGSTQEQIVIILYGTGSNGKSTLLGVIGDILGDYAAQIESSTLMVKRGESINNDIARLAGRRFVSAIEAEAGKRLAESLVKTMSGGDRMVARFLHKEFFEFKPEFKVFLATNHRPRIYGTDHAIWRRIRLVPFDVVIPDGEQDSTLPEKLRRELPGILAWMVRGCFDWQQHGLGEAEEVMAATQDYRNDQDVLREFLTERCYEHSGASATSKDLYEAYKLWANDSGEHPISQRLFGERLGERGFRRERRSSDGRMQWNGICLISDGYRDHPEPSEPSEPNSTIFAPIGPRVEKTLKQGSEGSEGSADPLFEGPGLGENVDEVPPWGTDV